MQDFKLEVIAAEFQKVPTVDRMIVCFIICIPCFLLCSKMSVGETQPFIGSQAFNKATSAFVSFPSQSDAMLASLQLFHDVPCRIMNLVISMITHPDFDNRQVTLRDSVDVIRITEDDRLRERMVTVHERAVIAEGLGHTEQRPFPQVILDEVLDTIHRERLDNIDASYEEGHCNFNDGEQVTLLSNLSLVHRSWTFPAQKALGRILSLKESIIYLDFLSRPTRYMTFGPWTSVVAINFLHINSLDLDAYIDTINETHQRLENLHRLLLGLDNLKRIYIQSSVPYLTVWADFMVREVSRRNTSLEVLALRSEHDPDIEGTPTFNLNPLLHYRSTLDNLRSLNVRGAMFSEEAWKRSAQETMFASLRSLNITFRSATDLMPATLLSLLAVRSNLQCGINLFSVFAGKLGSFGTMVTGTAFTTVQCAAMFRNIRALHIDSPESDRWINWIVTHCLSLTDLNIRTDVFTSSEVLSSLPNTLQNVDIGLRGDILTHEEGKIALSNPWTKLFMSLPSSGLLPGLKSLAVSFEGLEVEEDDGGFSPQYITLETLTDCRAAMKDYSDKMTKICADMEISFSFSFSFAFSDESH